LLSRKQTVDKEAWNTAPNIKVIWVQLQVNDSCCHVFSPVIITMIKSRVYAVRITKQKNTQKILDGIPHGKRPRGKAKCRRILKKQIVDTWIRS
jgi:hypothetical protein